MKEPVEEAMQDRVGGQTLEDYQLSKSLSCHIWSKFITLKTSERLAQLQQNLFFCFLNCHANQLSSNP